MHWKLRDRISLLEPEDAGVTLIELLIICMIISMLSIIAIPYLHDTREGARVAGMESDLRNVGTAMEGYFADNQTYPELRQEGATLVLGTQSLQLTPGNNIRSVIGSSVQPGSFCLEANMSGVTATRAFDSDGGGLRSGSCT